MTRIVRVTASSRLHFGMFSFGHAEGPQFGGVGAMVEPPAVEVTISPAERFAATGMLTSRVEKFSQTAVRHWQLRELPPCEIKVAAPPDHVGLGVGTQLGLAVAAGLRKFLSFPDQSMEELASSIGRGMRSAVGTYGFGRGGLIVDAGKEPGEPLGKLAHRVALPAEWRIALVRTGDAQGLAGDFEADAFGRLPPVSRDVTRELWRIAEAEMLPAVDRSDCAAFGEAVYHFGRLAGQCFAPVQGGPFAGPAIELLVDSIRDYGVTGVGQSSWGPTVFAFAASDEEAQALREWLRESLDVQKLAVTIARPNNSGAHIIAE